MDPGSFSEVARDLQTWLAAGHPGPRFLTTGPNLRLPDGYGHPRYGAVSNAQEVAVHLDLIESLGGVGAKIAIQEGFEDFPPELWQVIQREATQRGLPLYIHATSEVAQRAALEHGAHAIMHAVLGGAWVGQFFGVEDLSNDFVQRMARSGAYQLTTFSFVDSWPTAFDIERLDDPLVRLTVPAVELETARDPMAKRSFAIRTLGYFAPWTFEWVRPWLARQLWSRENLDAGVRYSQRNVLKLHRAGVPIVAATDVPSPWPDAIANFHGPQMAREVELLGQAGLSPMEAIISATRIPAEMLGLADEIGTVEVGKRADLLIVRGDPLEDLRALRQVLWTVAGGVARTPEEWMGP